MNNSFENIILNSYHYWHYWLLLYYTISYKTAVIFEICLKISFLLNLIAVSTSWMQILVNTKDNKQHEVEAPQSMLQLTKSIVKSQRYKIDKTRLHSFFQRSCCSITKTTWENEFK